MEKKRVDIVNELKEFYQSEGILPNEKFDCKNKNECNIRYGQIANGELLAQGMQCHVGTKYGENKIKALVVSLDCGGGGAQNIEERTKSVEIGGTNTHMLGTTKSISHLLFGDKVDTTKECLQYYAMTNACKCCRKNSSNQLPPFFYEQCNSYKIKEIEIINPNIIYFQGNSSLNGIHFSNIDNQTTDIFEYLKTISVGDKNIFAVKCIHPSARGKHVARRNKFYIEMLPKINDYLREKLK